MTTERNRLAVAFGSCKWHERAHAGRSESLSLRQEWRTLTTRGPVVYRRQSNCQFALSESLEYSKVEVEKVSEIESDSVNESKIPLRTEDRAALL